MANKNVNPNAKKALEEMKLLKMLMVITMVQ